MQSIRTQRQGSEDVYTNAYFTLMGTVKKRKRTIPEKNHERLYIDRRR